MSQYRGCEMVEVVGQVMCNVAHSLTGDGGIGVEQFANVGELLKFRFDPDLPMGSLPGCSARTTGSPTTIVAHNLQAYMPQEHIRACPTARDYTLPPSSAS